MSRASQPASAVVAGAVWIFWGALVASASLAGETAARPLTLRIAYSPELRRVHGWSVGLDCAVNRAGGILEETVGRGLTIRSKVPWSGAAVGRSARELREALADEIEPEGADLVVGLGVHARKPPPGPRPEGILTEPSLDFTRDEGLANYTMGYLALDVRGEEPCVIYRLLAHEIAHLFGGVHRRGRNLLMDPAGVGIDGDPLNAELFALHRDRSFGVGKAPLAGDDLHTMWRLARAAVDDAQTWLVVGVLAARMGQPVAAARHYERALSIDPDHQQALVNLGHVQLQVGALRAAEVSYLRALEIASGGALVHNNLAAVYYALGTPEKAFAHLARALAQGFDVDSRFIAEIEAATGRSLQDVE